MKIMCRFQFQQPPTTVLDMKDQALLAATDLNREVWVCNATT